jgi:DNA-binding response OmpR family regulator
VVVVDLSLPDGNGMELVRSLAQAGDCGIVVLTGNPDADNRVAGLDTGADDYIAKPPSNRELIARIRAVHRRVLAGRQAAVPPQPARPASRPSAITIAKLRIDLRQRRATDSRGQPLLLSAAEFAVLDALAAAGGEVVSQERLCEVALRRPLRVEDRSVSQLVHGLRRKLVAAGADERVIQTVRAAGYALRLADQA